MRIEKTKYQNDVRDAYIRGLEFGFELAKKLREIMMQKNNESASMPEQYDLEEFSLLLHQLIEIARTKGIDLE